MVFLLSRAIRRTRSQRSWRKSTRLELEQLEERALLSSGYIQKNLTGYQPGMAHYTDPLLNGWGLAFAPDGPFWVADTATGVSTIYDHQGKPLPLVVNIPGGLPTGIVYNPSSDFTIAKNGVTAPALFIFDTIGGTISGWNPAVDPTNAVVMVDNSKEPTPAAYFGIVIAQNSAGQNVLYAADSNNDRIDMFDGALNSLGSFNDPSVATQLPGYVAYQVENVNNQLFVTYISFGSAPFGGVVDVFDTAGNLLTPNHFAINQPGAGPLYNPWGIAQAPSNFGIYSNDILIGNVEDGHINAFDPNSGAFIGAMKSPDGTPITIPGLWDLAFGAGSPNNGKTNELFFTAGPNAINFAGNGLFGVIHAAGNGDTPGGSGNGNGAAPITVAVPASGAGATVTSAVSLPNGVAPVIAALSAPVNALSWNSIRVAVTLPPNAMGRDALAAYLQLLPAVTDSAHTVRAARVSAHAVERLFTGLAELPDGESWSVRL
jgi:uncharacterized protein (TIGR03118 family)